jgi:urease accessory protein
MECFTKRIAAIEVQSVEPPMGTLALPFGLRQKTRQRAVLQSGQAIGLVLPRGTVMRGGDRLVSVTGCVIEVVASPEPVSTVRSDAAYALAQAAYHLGNRHVWVQVGAGWLRYLADYVLDDMMRGLGLEPEFQSVVFEPEAGAYADHSHTQDPHSHSGDGEAGHDHG